MAASSHVWSKMAIVNGDHPSVLSSGSLSADACVASRIATQPRGWLPQCPAALLPCLSACLHLCVHHACLFGQEADVLGGWQVGLFAGTLALPTRVDRHG